MASNDLQLLCNALSTQGEAEGDGVKYIWMDNDTVYRFENNRMKKVSKAMLNKANKLILQQNSIPGQQPPKKTRGRKAAQQPTPQPQPIMGNAYDEEEEDEPEPEPEPLPPPKPKRTRKPKTPSVPAPTPSTIDLNEYWQVKNKNEYMTNEIDRLNHKVSKLKQYKSIVNKLTGGEYDPVEPPTPMQSQPQQPQTYPQQGMRQVNDSLFMF